MLIALYHSSKTYFYLNWLEWMFRRREIYVRCYIDVWDTSILKSGKELLNWISIANLNLCIDYFNIVRRSEGHPHNEAKWLKFRQLPKPEFVFVCRMFPCGQQRIKENSEVLQISLQHFRWKEKCETYHNRDILDWWMSILT